MRRREPRLHLQERYPYRGLGVVRRFGNVRHQHRYLHQFHGDSRRGPHVLVRVRTGRRPASGNADFEPEVPNSGRLLCTSDGSELPRQCEFLPPLTQAAKLGVNTKCVKGVSNEWVLVVNGCLY